MSFSGAGIYLISEEEKNIQHWIKGMKLEPVKNNLPFDQAIEQIQIVKDLWRAKESGEPIINKSYSKKDKNEFFDYISRHNDSSGIPEEVKKFIYDAETYVVTVAVEKHSLIGLDSWSGPVTSTEDFQILKRFVRVFEQAYIRFLDLQKAEAQAREAKIEYALEKVRSRTMAMQKSDELAEVAAIMFKQVNDLSIKTWTTGFNVWSEDNNSWTDYVTNPEGGFIEPYIIDATEFSVFIEVSNAKKRGDEFYVQYVEGEMLKETYRQLSSFAADRIR